MGLLLLLVVVVVVEGWCVECVGRGGSLRFGLEWRSVGSGEETGRCFRALSTRVAKRRKGKERMNESGRCTMLSEF
ncbi:hypothetical protein KC322_g2 [Hortaea werneckii]|nr:hypothetical protein KC322_g2 [Hortaea werneckii]